MPFKLLCFYLSFWEFHIWVLYIISIPPSLLQFLLCLTHSLLSSWLLFCYSFYNLLAPFSAALMYVFRPDYLGLDNLLRGSSLEKTGSPLLCSHWLSVALHFRVGLCEVSPTTLACQLVLSLCRAYLCDFFFKFHGCRVRVRTSIQNTIKNYTLLRKWQ